MIFEYVRRLRYIEIIGEDDAPYVEDENLRIELGFYDYQSPRRVVEPGVKLTYYPDNPDKISEHFIPMTAIKALGE